MEWDLGALCALNKGSPWLALSRPFECPSVACSTPGSLPKNSDFAHWAPTTHHVLHSLPVNVLNVCRCSVCVRKCLQTSADICACLHCPNKTRTLNAKFKQTKMWVEFNSMNAFFYLTQVLNSKFVANGSLSSSVKNGSALVLWALATSSLPWALLLSPWHAHEKSVSRQSPLPLGWRGSLPSPQPTLLIRRPLLLMTVLFQST